MFMQTYAYHNTWNSFPKSSLLKHWVMLGYFLAPYVHSDAGLQVTGVGGGRHFLFLLGITKVMSLHFDKDFEWGEVCAMGSYGNSCLLYFQK